MRPDTMPRGSATTKKKASTRRARPAPPAEPGPRRRRATARPSSLREYEAKRDFHVTREPAPAAGPAPRGRPTYMVHKHHATRLHYDLRLEMEGVLASWAVPKGPSYDPAVKRMAVQTEDHPFEYGKFEGRIPDGEYGGGDSLIWDRGTYDTHPPGEGPEQRRRGRMVLDFDGEKLKGRWYLVRTAGGGQGGKAGWILFKAKDERADAEYDVVADRPESVVSGRSVTRGPETARVLRAPRPAPDRLLAGLAPMLATLADAPPEDEDAWQLELKYDGIRALCALSSGRVLIQSRNGQDYTRRFAPLADALSRIVVGDAVIDAEVVALGPGGAPSYQGLQRGDGELRLVAFDLLRLDGDDLRGRPLEERRGLLQSLLELAPPSIGLSELVTGPVKDALAAAAARGYEGLLAKRHGAPYEGRRSRLWLKLKALATQDAAVIGYTPVKGNPGEVGALLLAIHERGRLRYAGRVGTGFTRAVRRSLRRELAGDALEAPAALGAPRVRDATWVRPRLVVEVAFTEWTRDDVLRHASFQRLREDKSPEHCVRERPVDPDAVGDAPPAGSGSGSGSGSASASRRTSRRTPAALPPVEVRFTSPDRLLYPKDGITKQQVADYLQAVAEPVLVALADRPLALERWPQGVGADSWYQQNIGPREAKPWLRLAEVPTRTDGRRVRHLVVDRRETLTWLAQHAALTLHMFSSRVPHLEQPDWAIFDLDPADGQGFEQVIEPAHALRRLFEELKLPSFVKTTGKRGLHVLVPLAPGHRHDEAQEFALRVAGAVAESLPQVTLERSKAARRGRLYLDCLQNGFGKTIVAPYSLRGADGAPVSAPLEWDEVDRRLEPAKLSLRTMPRRLAKVGDLFGPILAQGVRLPRLR